MRESKTEHKVCEWAIKQGIKPLKLTPYGEAGWPDRFYLFFHPAIAFIEFKAPKKGPRPLQAERIAELQRRGYPVAVIRSVADGIAFLEREILLSSANSRLVTSDDKSG
jgi:hypothetical protein